MLKTQQTYNTAEEELDDEEPEFISKAQHKSEPNLAKPSLSVNNDRDGRNDNMEVVCNQAKKPLRSYKSDSHLECKTHSSLLDRQRAVHLLASTAAQLDNTASHDKPHINILLVGCKGNGKSHTGNTILGQEVFKCTRKGGTQETDAASTTHLICSAKELRVTVVDTPGVSQEMTESEFEELVRAVKMVPEGFDAICLVWDYNNSDKNDDEVKKEVRVFHSLHRLFGDELYEHLVILVTHAQQRDIPQFCENLQGPLKQITGSHPNRVVAINNSPTNDSMPDGVQELLQMVHELSTTSDSGKYKASNLSADCQTSQFGVAELHLLLVGKTGVGKSQTGNSIIGTDTFTVSDIAVSKTVTCEDFKRKVGSLTLNIVDTPGIDVFDKKCEKEIVKWFQEKAANLDAILLVSNGGNYGAADEKMVSILTGILGDRFLDYAIMVITGKDQLSGSDEEYIKESNPKFKATLEKCHGRFVFFDNITQDETLRQEQLVKLIKLVQQVKHDNPPIFNTENISKHTGRNKQSIWFRRVLKRVRSCSCFITRESYSLNQPQSDNETFRRSETFNRLR